MKKKDGVGRMDGVGLQDSTRMQRDGKMQGDGTVQGNAQTQGGAKRRSSQAGKPKRVRAVWALSIAAALLLAFSAANSSRAALTYYSENYSAEFQMFDIGVTLMENGNEASWRNYTQKDDVWQEGGGELLAGLPDGENGGKIQPGKTYSEELSVRNSGSIDQYVRVILYRYWEDKDGNRVTDVSPELIELGLTGNGWVEDTSASTEERMVLYYTGIVPAGQQTPPLLDTLTINEKAALMMSGEENREEAGADGNARDNSSTGQAADIGPAYSYNGLRFVLEAEVNAVQTHNAEEAIRSAWGVNVSVGADGGLNLK